MHVAMLADLSPNGSPSGGVQRAVLTLASALIDRGIKVTLVCPAASESHVRRERTGELEVVRTPMGGRLQVFGGYRGWSASAAQALAELRPDLVHAHGTLHHGAAAAAWTGCPTLVTAHGNPVEDARWHYPEPVRSAVLPLLRRAATRAVTGADAVIGVSAEWSVNCPIEPRRFVHIPNPIEDCFFCEPNSPASAGSASTVLAAPSHRVVFAGGTRRIKGLDLLLRAWRSVLEQVADATLELYGVTSADVHAHGTEVREGVVAQPALESCELARRFADDGVVVVPSRFEVSPLVIAEAWASRRPVVATRVGGVPSMAADRAHLCEPESEDLARALIATLTANGGGVDETVRAGRLEAERYRAESVAAAHIELYASLASGAADGTRS